MTTRPSPGATWGTSSGVSICCVRSSSICFGCTKRGTSSRTSAKRSPSTMPRRRITSSTTARPSAKCSSSPDPFAPSRKRQLEDAKAQRRKGAKAGWATKNRRESRLTVAPSASREQIPLLQSLRLCACLLPFLFVGAQLGADGGGGAHDGHAVVGGRCVPLGGDERVEVHLRRGGLEAARFRVEAA